MIKNTTHIKALLHKYFEGETSLEEEKTLKEYFNSHDIASELQVYQGLFQFFKTEKNIILPQERHTTSVVPLYDTSPKQQTATIKRLYNHIAKIAAIALLVIGAYWFLLPTNHVEQRQAINWEKYEITDEKEAMEKTIAALRLVSSKLNRGAKRAAKEVHQVQAAARIFKK